MRHRINWTRRRQAARNFLLWAVTLLALWMALGYPALWAEQALRRGEEAWLVEDLPWLARSGGGPT